MAKFKVTPTDGIPTIQRGRTNQFLEDWSETIEAVLKTNPPAGKTYKVEDVPADTASKMNKHYNEVLRAYMRDLDTENGVGTVHFEILPGD
jgi:hypothetical protein